jgi:hypothetical protein
MRATFLRSPCNSIQDAALHPAHLPRAGEPFRACRSARKHRVHPQAPCSTFTTSSGQVT